MERNAGSSLPSLPSKMVRQLANCHTLQRLDREHLLYALVTRAVIPYRDGREYPISDERNTMEQWSAQPEKRFRMSGLKVVGDSRSQPTRAFQAAHCRFCRHEAQSKWQTLDMIESSRGARRERMKFITKGCHGRAHQGNGKEIMMA